jgi:hypothetical protein
LVSFGLVLVWGVVTLHACIQTTFTQYTQYTHNTNTQQSSPARVPGDGGNGKAAPFFEDGGFGRVAADIVRVVRALARKRSADQQVRRRRVQKERRDVVLGLQAKINIC